MARRSCNESVIYYAPSWRGLINGQRIGSDLGSMSALIGRVRSSTAFAKLMQIMRAGTEDDEANDDDDDDRGGWGWGMGMGLLVCWTYQCRPNESSGPKRILWVRLSGHKSG